VASHPQVSLRSTEAETLHAHDTRHGSYRHQFGELACLGRLGPLVVVHPVASELDLLGLPGFTQNEARGHDHDQENPDELRISQSHELAPILGRDQLSRSCIRPITRVSHSRVIRFGTKMTLR
jgi:hypothetical protein